MTIKRNDSSIMNVVNYLLANQGNISKRFKVPHIKNPSSKISTFINSSPQKPKKPPKPQQ